MYLIPFNKLINYIDNIQQGLYFTLNTVLMLYINKQKYAQY